jgi:hypothetical protein
MARSLNRIALIAAAALGALALAAATPGAARAQKYTDVPKGEWAYNAIVSVTDRGTTSHKVLDDYGSVFKPETAITREKLARSLVIAAGHYGEIVTPVAITDVPAGYRYYKVIQAAVHHGYLTLGKDGSFRPLDPVPASVAEVAVVRWLKERYSAYDWSLLKTLKPSAWEPNKGWKTGAPGYLPYIVASRQLQLRFNHPDTGDGHEVTPAQPIDRAELAYMFWRAYSAGGEWELSGLSGYSGITLPALSTRQKEIVKFALKYIGYPYIWGGEYPTKDSPYGYQKAGGFDCSGLVFYIMKMHFGYPITVNERGAHDMAARAKPRIKRSQLKCGDLIFFGPTGPSSSVNSIYHAGLYLGGGWFIHSTGSSDGVTLQSLNTSSYYKSAFAWGRRVLKASELVIPAATPAAGTATPAALPSASPSAAAPPAG